MKIPEILIPGTYNFEKKLQRSVSRLKYRYTIDIFGNRTFTFKTKTDYKKFKEEYEITTASERFLKDLKNNKYKNVLGGDFEELKKQNKKEKENDTTRDN